MKIFVNFRENFVIRILKRLKLMTFFDYLGWKMLFKKFLKLILTIVSLPTALEFSEILFYRQKWML